MGEPRTTREALIAHMLGELDDLMTRAERLPTSIAEAEARLAITAQVLSDAGDKYRLAVAAFTEEAKSALTEHIELKMSHTLTLAINEQRALMREAVEAAFRATASPRTGDTRSYPPQSSTKRRHLLLTRLLEHAVTAALASIFTVALLSFVVDRS